MKKFEKLEETTAPDGSVLSLFRHDGDYFIRIAGVELMSTRRHASEELLADLVCAPLRPVTGACVLIGGLGFGFTLRAALRNLADDAEVIVVELLRSIVGWNENPSYALAGAALRDPRVEVRTADVARVIASSPARTTPSCWMSTTERTPSPPQATHDCTLITAFTWRRRRFGRVGN